MEAEKSGQRIGRAYGCRSDKLTVVAVKNPNGMALSKPILKIVIESESRYRHACRRGKAPTKTIGALVIVVPRPKLGEINSGSLGL